MAYNVGLTGPYDFDGAIQNMFFASMANYFANRTPLAARLPNRRSSATTIKAVDDSYRVGSTAINDANNITNSATSITVDDASGFESGDVIKIDSEYMVLTAASGTTLTVGQRGFAGTTAAAHNDDATITLISNVRTGAEVDVSASTRVFDTSTTYMQTVQHPYQIGGSLEASSPDLAIPMGLASMVGYQRAKAMQHTMDDFERAIYYGKAAGLSADTSTPMMRGLQQRLATNNVTSPTNGSGYGPDDLIRDTLQAARTGGGEPDVLFLSPDFMTGLAIWGQNVQRVGPGATVFGTPIKVFEAPFLNGILLVECPLLSSGTAFCLTSQEVYMAWKREPFDKPRGSRGDAFEGDVIGEGTLVVNNEAHHAWVQGISGFAA